MSVLHMKKMMVVEVYGIVEVLVKVIVSYEKIDFWLMLKFSDEVVGGRLRSCELEDREKGWRR